jgi:hypothetical protein
MDNKVCASYKRSQAFCEDFVGRGVAWLDHVPGKDNPADVLTKQVRHVGEFEKKVAMLSGEKPFMHESSLVHGILEETH